MKKYNVAIVGATGAVGEELFRVLEEVDFPQTFQNQPHEEIVKTFVHISSIFSSIVCWLQFQIAVNIIKYHHEKWNGKGYCEGLSKNDIPIEARIVSIADVFDALTTERPYKKAFSIEEAIRIMKEEMYDSFDPQLLELFLCDIEKIQKIKEKLED